MIVFDGARVGTEICGYGLFDDKCTSYAVLNRWVDDAIMRVGCNGKQKQM